MSAMTQALAWPTAERRVFDEIRDRLGHKEGINCFLGYIPVDVPNVWAFVSGGGTAGIENKTLVNNNAACWSTSIVDARLIGVYSERAAVMEWSGEVLQVFQDTFNFHQRSNVVACRIQEMPSLPIFEIFQDEEDSGLGAWIVIIPCQLLFSTTQLYTDT